MLVEIEARVYDTRDGTLVGLIVTDGVKIACFDGSGTPHDHVLECIASFVHQYKCVTYRRAVATVPYPQALYESLLQTDVPTGPWRIVTNILQHPARFPLRPRADSADS